MINKSTISAMVHIFLAGSFLLASCQSATQKHNRDDRPNILFIMSDDHAYQAISAYSSYLIQTPNIDRIAREGMLFTNACVTNSICAPSRAVILTGKHSHLNGKVDNYSPFDTSQVTFPRLLQNAGYQTALFGKLHFGNKPVGFDQYRILPGQGSYYNPDFITKNEGTVQLEGYSTDLITDITLEWLETERDHSKPFFLACLHKAPHREWLPAERHYREFMHRNFPEPPSLFDDNQGRGTAARSAEMSLLEHMNWAGDSKIYPELMDELGIPDVSGWDKQAFQRSVGRLNPEQRKAWDEVYGPMNEEFRQRYPEMTEEEKMRWRYQRYMQDYLACVQAVDEGVGRLLDYLDANGLSENTLVIYTSDQGFYLGEYGWFDKRFIYNESFKTPLMVRWPDIIEEGATCERLVQNLDFAQTILEAAGVDPLEDMQGKSLVPLLRGEEDTWDRDAVYYHYYEYPSIHMVKRHYGIITMDYKLVHFYYDVDEWELYDRQKDPMEQNNVIHDPEYAGIADGLKERLAEMRLAYEDSVELDHKYLQMFLEKK
jgi:arylsulfatase A-like enzyme